MLDLEDIWNGLLRDVGTSLGEAGQDALNAVADQAEFAADRAQHLQQFVGQPGYREAVQAEIDTVLVRSGLSATEQADQFDARIVSIVETALNALARVARTVAG